MSRVDSMGGGEVRVRTHLVHFAAHRGFCCHAISSVDYREDALLDAIGFTTNLGRKFGIVGGDGASGSYTVTKGEKLGCMWGRAVSSIDSIVFSSTGAQ